MDISVSLRNERSKFIWAERRCKNIKKDISNPLVTHVLGDLNVGWALISEKDKYSAVSPAVSPSFYSNITSAAEAEFESGAIAVSSLFTTTPTIDMASNHVWQTIVATVKLNGESIDLNNLSVTLTDPSGCMGLPLTRVVSQIIDESTVEFSFAILPTENGNQLINGLTISYPTDEGTTAPTASYQVSCRAMVI